MVSFLSRQVLDTLAEIQERHEAVKELERSLLDLHQIFLDMAVLVEAQGEMLDNIEAQVHVSWFWGNHRQRSKKDKSSRQTSQLGDCGVVCGKGQVQGPPLVLFESKGKLVKTKSCISKRHLILHSAWHCVTAPSPSLAAPLVKFS